MTTFQESLVSIGTGLSVEDELARRENAVEEARRALKRVHDEAHHGLAGQKTRAACLAALKAIDTALSADDPPKEKGNVVFALVPATDASPMTVAVGVPRGAYAHMQAGNTTHFDLSRTGIKLGFLIFACDNVDAGRALLMSASAKQGVTMMDARREDFSGAFGGAKGGAT